MEPNDRLRAAREACPSPSAPGEPMSRAELAEAVNDHLWHTTGQRHALDAHAIARYERGKITWPNAAYRAGLKAVLGVDSDAELGFHPARRREGRSATTTVSGDGVLASMVPGRMGEPHPPKVEKQDVAAMRQMLSALTASDRRFGGTPMREHAVNYFVQLVRPRLHAHADERTGRELLSCATEFALRVASLELDTGHVGESRRWLGVASGLAQESGDLSLEAWTLTRRGEQEIHEAALAEHRGEAARREGHVRRAVACSGAAAALAGCEPSMAQAFLLAKYALALSMTGQRREVERVFSRVWRSVDRSGSSSEPEWAGLYSPNHLRHEEARCYAMLGEGRAAVQAARESLRARSDPRPKALTLGILALGHARAGDIDAACAVGHELVVLAQAAPSHRVGVRLGEVLSAVRRYSGSPSVRDLHGVASPVITELVDG